jgi:bifunctional enzyme CysN/CysC
MDTTALKRGKVYLIKQITHIVRSVAEDVAYRFDPEDHHRKPADTLSFNEIGRVTFNLLKPIYTDSYTQNRQTGCFIIDPTTNQTAGADVITRCRYKETAMSCIIEKKNFPESLNT